MTPGELFEASSAATILSAAPSSSAVVPRAGAASRQAVLPRPGRVDERTTTAPSLPRYEVLKRLGEGSFGEVELVRDNDIDRLVALKRLKPEAHDPDTVQRFGEEVQIVGGLEHPGIIAVHDVGLDESGYFFVMKYLDGEDLEGVIRRLRERDPEAEARFTMEERARIFLAVCRAVEFAHEKGLVHRDIKPGNIMVGRYGEVVLMDWGLAKRLAKPEDPARGGAQGGATQASTMLGFALGTPAYMPPEQARGEHDRTDGRADVYSLCATFFELFTLRHYLEPKDDVTSLLEAVKTEQPMSAIDMHHRHQVPPEITWIIRKGLEKDPARRFQSVRELSGRIVRAMQGRNPVECPCTGLKRANGGWSRFIDRHPYPALFIAAFGVAAALTGVASMLSSLIAALR